VASQDVEPGPPIIVELSTHMLHNSPTSSQRTPSGRSAQMTAVLGMLDTVQKGTAPALGHARLN
jgi:hypothetical protein